MLQATNNNCTVSNTGVRTKTVVTEDQRDENTRIFFFFKPRTDLLKDITLRRPNVEKKRRFWTAVKTRVRRSGGKRCMDIARLFYTSKTSRLERGERGAGSGDENESATFSTRTIKIRR